MSPEQNLAFAVIAQAIRDCICDVREQKRKRIVREFVYKSEAFTFLTATSGAWFYARRMWCEAADICHARLRKRFIIFFDDFRTNYKPCKERDVLAKIMGGDDENIGV